MTKDLIRYPLIDYEIDGGWRNTGEGGQFFYAVWNSAEEADCSVDVAPEFHMADVLVAAHGPLADVFDDQQRRYYAESRRATSDYEAAWSASAISFDTVLLLGTTGTSFFSDEYFAIKSAEDLTEAGQAIVEAISAHMGSEPTFVSYLDT